MSTPRFNCDRCGLCCRSIGGIPQLKQYDRGDGVCSHLTDANLCDMYDSRPEVCNVERMYSRFASEMTWDEYISLMEASCECLKRNFQRDERFQLDSHRLAEFLDNVPQASLESLAAEVGVHRESCRET